MHGPSTTELEISWPLATWSDHNERGLAFAADGAWEEATEAFAGAADSVAQENDVASHEALALILSNLAQGCYRVGRVEDAVRHAQRVCALRVALVGEYAIAVARARTDLAVILASTGRVNEGLALVTRAIAGIEQSAGDEEPQLTYVLENAARLAMSAGQPSTAEPYLLRLHALLAVHELPTDRADTLLAAVAQHRASARVSFGLPMTIADHADDGAASSEDVRAETVSADTTAIEEPTTEETAIEVLAIEVLAIEELAIDEPAIEEEPATEEIAIEEPVADETDADDAVVAGGLLGLDFDLVELAPVMGSSVETSNSEVSVEAPVLDVLGFDVQYGTPTDGDAPVHDVMMARPTSTRIPTPAPTARGTPFEPMRTVPSQASSQPAVPPPGAMNASTQPPDDALRERRIRRPNVRAGRATTPRSSRGFLITGAVTTAIAGVIGWMVFAR